MGIQEEDVFITSPVKYLPVKGTPSRENVEHGRSHLLKQLAVIDPGIIVLMGGVACLGVLGENIRVSKEHGQVIERDGRKCLITFHPAYAARFPEGRKVFLQDLKKLKSLISA
jgi:DNA polymerase